jgi:CelD/BcsL family acetyltransferase involved in cellulose biosynthesis
MESPQVEAEFLAKPPLESAWQALAGAVAPKHGFLTAAWFNAWDRHLLPYENWRGPLRYLAARGPAHTLNAVLPLATQRQLGIAVASLGGLYWPFRAPLIAESTAEATCHALAATLTQSRSLRPLRYGPVPDDDAGTSCLNAALAKWGWRLRRSTLGTTYAVDLPGTWAELERRLGKSLRTNVEYYERKLGREGALDIRCIRGPDNPDWQTVVDDLGSIEQRSWQFRERGRMRFHGERNAAFWRDLLVGNRFGQVAIAWVMHFNGEPVSFCFCLDCGDIRYIFANNYAESVHRYSTGSVLYKHVFRDAIESGAIRRINIGLGDPGYKSRWSAQPAFDLVDWIAFPPGLRGGSLDFAWRLRGTLSRLRIARRTARDEGGDATSNASPGT